MFFVRHRAARLAQSLCVVCCLRNPNNKNHAALASFGVAKPLQGNDTIAQRHRLPLLLRATTRTAGLGGHGRSTGHEHFHYVRICHFGSLSGLSLKRGRTWCWLRAPPRALMSGILRWCQVLDGTWKGPPVLGSVLFFSALPIFHPLVFFFFDPCDSVLVS